MSKIKENAVSVAEAARRGHVSSWNIRMLIKHQIVQAEITDQGMFISADVIDDLRRLCRYHISRRGEFLHNAPEIGAPRYRNIDGIESVHVRGEI